jgi:hypothetical protein
MYHSGELMWKQVFAGSVLTVAGLMLVIARVRVSAARADDSSLGSY